MAGDGFPYHLVQANWSNLLASLLWDPDWLFWKLHDTSISDLIADFSLIPGLDDEEDKEKRGLRMLRDALRLSSHILARDPFELPGQLLGRLGYFVHRSEGVVARLRNALTAKSEGSLVTTVRELREFDRFPWLCPLVPSLLAPGGALIRTLAGHESVVSAIIATRDGAHVVSGSSDTTIKVWDRPTGRELRTLRGHSRHVVALALTPNERWIVSGSTDGTIRVWELSTGDLVRTIEAHRSGVLALALLSDGKSLLSGGSDTAVRLWDLESGRMLYELGSHEERVTALVVSDDGALAVSGSEDSTLRVWSLEGHGLLRTLTGHKGGINAVVLTGDGQTAFSTSAQDHSLRKWDIESGEPISMTKIEWPRSLVLTDDERHVMVGLEAKTIEVREVTTSNVVKTLRGHFWGVWAIATIPNSHIAVSGSWDRNVNVWDLHADGFEVPSPCHAGQINQIHVDARGRLAIVASADGALSAWDLRKLSKVREFRNHHNPVGAVTTTPDGKTVISASNDIRIWNTHTGAETGRLNGHTSQVMLLTMTPDGQRLVSASGDVINVWDWKTGQTLTTIQFQLAERLARLAVSPDGRFAVGCTWQAFRFIVWDLATGEEILSFGEGYAFPVALAISPDGSKIISDSPDGYVRIYELKSGEELACLTEASFQANAFAFIDEKQLLVSATRAQTIIVGDLGADESIAVFTGTAEMTACAVASQEHLIVAGEKSGRLHFLRIVEGSFETGTK